MIQATAIVLLNESEALTLTERIKRGLDDLWRDLYEAHERQAWKAMGYESWKAYCEGALKFSADYGHKQIAHARFMLAIEEALGNTTVLSPPERVTREIPREDIPDVVESVRERVEAGEEPEAAVNNAIREHQRLPTPGQAREIARDTGVAVAGSDGYYHDGRTAEEEERASVDANVTYGILEAIETLASADIAAHDYVKMVPAARAGQLQAHVPSALAWLEALKGAMS